MLLELTTTNIHSKVCLMKEDSTARGNKYQVLLILTGSGKSLNDVVSALDKIAPTMPYR